MNRFMLKIEKSDSALGKNTEQKYRDFNHLA
jgi:hypothetical protein